MTYSRKKLITFAFVFCLVLLPCMNESSHAVDQCCGYSSSGDPYACCGSKGNCTWYAWKKAKDEWGKKLNKWGDAKLWASKAKAEGYKVSATPAVDTIGVNTTARVDGVTYGHVVWIKKVEGNYVYTSEMQWCNGCKKEIKWNKSYFDGGFIYKKK